MRKHGLGALALALVLTVTTADCFSLNVSAEEGGALEAASVSGNEARSVDATDESKTSLTVPTELTWGDNYALVFNGLEGCKSYKVEIYKDDKLYKSMIFMAKDYSPVTIPSYSYGGLGSGTFKYRICAEAADKVHPDSEWSDWSEEKTYVRPDRQVGTTTVYWDTERAGWVNFVAVDNAGRYGISLFKDGIFLGIYYISADEAAGQIISHDFSKTTAKGGQYTVDVIAYSADLDQFANGKTGPMSDIYDTTVGTSELGSILTDAMANQSASDAAETLKNSADISAVQVAMQTSDSFRGQVKELEEKYAAEKGITTSRDVSEEAKAYVDPDRVEIVGAAFNAVGSNVQFSMDVTPEEKKVPLHENYLNSVQLDIKLTSDSAEVHKLEVPVSITMPVPAGIDVRQLVILHYHQDGTVERAAYRVNGDGTITFTVREFSTFVFAGKGSNSNNSNNNNAGGDSSVDTQGGAEDEASYSDSVEDMILSAAPKSVITITREQGINTLSNSAMQALVKRGDVTLVMEYTYQGREYRIVIPAGKAENNDIPWYGPLYLSAYYSSGAAPVSGQGVYVVKKGDTLSAIARACGMSLAQLAAKNPQIKDVDFIRIGQKITLK